MKHKKEYYVCKQMINDSNITEGQIAFVEKKLKYLLETEESAHVNILCGKLSLIKNDIETAKYYFSKARDLPSSYYGLFKINVIEEDYQTAKANLEKFILLNKTKNLNLELYKLLLDKILNNNGEYNIDDNYFYQKLSGRNLILYLTSVKHILDEEYEDAINLLKELDENVKIEQLCIDFIYVIKLLQHLNQKKITRIDFDKKYDELKDSMWNNDSENIKFKLKEILELSLNEFQTKKMLHIIPKLLNIDCYEEANMINNNIRKKDIANKYSRMTEFYKRLIDELYGIYLLSGEKREVFQILIRKGIDSFNNEDYYNALNYFKAGLYKTEIQLFHYYIGKTLYRIDKHKEARRELLEYSKTGAYKAYLCKHYLGIINFNFGKKGKAEQMIEDAKYFASLINKTYDMSLKSLNRKKSKNNEMIFTEEDFEKGRTFILQ